MSVKEKILDILEERAGECVSGAELAERAAVSRNAVWKAINSLEASGMEISRSHSGYSLKEGLSERGIRRYLSFPESAEIRVYDSVDSTNSVMKAAAADGLGDRSVIAAKEQTAGRGRYDRVFYSGKGDGVYFSLLIRNVDFERGRFLTAIAAVAAVETLKERFGAEASIKWVNDIYVGGKKCAGILTEAVTDMELNAIAYAVIGIGLNLKKPRGGYPAKIAGTAGVPAEILPRDPYNLAVSEIAGRIYSAYDSFDRAELVEKYRGYSFLVGRKVGVMKEGRVVSEGVVKGIDDELSLVVESGDGKEERLCFGEVTLRL